MGGRSRPHSAITFFGNSPGSVLSPGQVPQPPARNAARLTRARFRLFPVRSPLLRESLLLSFPGATEMCHFTPLAYLALCIQARTTFLTEGRVFPLEISGSSACLRLTGAYRSLPRPFTPPGAKASTEHPFFLDYTHPSAELGRCIQNAGSENHGDSFA